jgi:hypothetical protein
LLHAAAWCVVITGLLTVQRGLSWARAASAGDAPACPACSEKPLELQIGAGFRQSS